MPIKSWAWLMFNSRMRLADWRCTHSTIIALFRYHSHMQIRMESPGFKWDLTPRGGAHRPNQPLGRWMDPRKPTHDVTDDSVHLYVRHLFPLFNQMKLGSGSLSQGWPTQEFRSRGEKYRRKQTIGEVQQYFHSTTADTLQWLRKTVVFILGVRGHTSTSTLSPGVGSTWFEQNVSPRGEGGALNLDRRPPVRLSHAAQSLGF